MNLPIIGIGFVHHHDGSVVLDGDRREGGALERRRNDDLRRFDEVGTRALKCGQINPVRSSGILLADEHIDVRAGLIYGNRGDIPEKVVDTGESVVRGLRARAPLVGAKTRLG